jgi:cysteinyl-tRNA synthetase
LYYKLYGGNIVNEHPIKIFDTMARQKRSFIPLNPPIVTMYNCGPTVYGDPHIGNLRSFTSGDLIRRWLEFRGYKVRYVMNITDIDDKTIRDSGKSGLSLKEFTEHYTRVFFRGLDKLNIKRAIVFPRATVFVPQMIEFIKELEEKGFAYNTIDGVYFDIKKSPNYGKLSGIDLSMTEQTKRVAEDTYDKEDTNDFVLWKKSTQEEIEREIYFESPWGPGRPGWHIECSVMSQSLLGKTIDIHAGGEDLVFPHHENEIAQSEAKNGEQFVRYWIHMRHLLIDGGKMSKSLGNYVSFDDVLQKHTPNAFRYFLISTHYRRPLNFTWSALKSAENTTIRLENTLNLIDDALKDTDDNIDFDNHEKKLIKDVEQAKTLFIKAMDDDFNTPIALGQLHAIREAINEYLTRPANKGVLIEAAKHYKESLEVLGLITHHTQGSDKITNDLIKIIIDLRQEKRNIRNFELADEIRDRLAEIGIDLQDKKEGTSWKISRK